MQVFIKDHDESRRLNHLEKIRHSENLGHAGRHARGVLSRVFDGAHDFELFGSRLQRWGSGEIAHWRKRWSVRPARWIGIDAREIRLAVGGSRDLLLGA